MSDLSDSSTTTKIEAKHSIPSSVVSAKPVVKPLKPGTPINRVAPTPPDPFIEAFADLITRTIAQNDPVSGPFIEFMEKYVVDMAPGKKVKNKDGAVYQQNFFKALKAVIEKSDSVTFRKNWIIVLSYFWRYRGDNALGERYVNRFANFWPAKNPNLDCFQRIVNLCLVSANPATRDKVTTQVDIVRTIGTDFTQVGETNIKAFYKV